MLIHLLILLILSSRFLGDRAKNEESHLTKTWTLMLLSSEHLGVNLACVSLYKRLMEGLESKDE